MKIVLASEAMECCAKAMDNAGGLPRGEYGEDRGPDIRAIYQAAAAIQAGWIAGAGRGLSPRIPIPEWLAKAGEQPGRADSLPGGFPG